MYLHDTNQRSLFAQDQRDLSHGCIRLEKPQELAKALLSTQTKWQGSAVENAVRSAESISIPLPQPVPIYLNYWTAWIDEEGQLHFANDLYGEDTQLAAAMRVPESRFTHWYKPISTASANPREDQP